MPKEEVREPFTWDWAQLSAPARIQADRPTPGFRAPWLGALRVQPPQTSALQLPHAMHGSGPCYIARSLQTVLLASRLHDRSDLL